MRLGLCCCFVHEPIKFRITTAANLCKLRACGQDPTQLLEDIIFHNAEALEKAIHYCADHGIGSFRISSDFLPLCTHPEFHYWIDDLPNAVRMSAQLAVCHDLAQQRGIRLTFHPNQFVVLNSPRKEVVHSSILNLHYHARLAERVGADVINIHAGGTYGDKKASLLRLVHNLQKLDGSIVKYLTLENDDISYTPQDLIPVCLTLGIPLVYDVHHHRCLTDEWTIEEATGHALKTWNVEPLFHISSPLNGWKSKNPRQHHDYINPDDFPPLWRQINPLTVDVEAKRKEEAIMRLIDAIHVEGPRPNNL